MTDLTHLMPISKWPPALASQVARFYLDAGDLEAADYVLAEALADAAPVDSALADAAVELALALGRTEIERAREWHRRALVAGAEQGRAAAAGAELALSAGATDEAVTLLEHRTGPAVARAWLKVGRRLIRQGDLERAADAFLAAARSDPDPSNFVLIGEHLAGMPNASDQTGMRPLRVAIIGSSTLDNVRAYLEVDLRLRGYMPAIYLAPFGQYASEILDPRSQLNAFRPDVVVVAVHGRSVMPHLYDGRRGLAPQEALEEGARVGDSFGSLLVQLADTTGALVLAHTFGVPRFTAHGVLDLRDLAGQTRIFSAVNMCVAEAARNHPRIHLIDEDRLFGSIGKQHQTDGRLMYLSREAFAEPALPGLAREYAKLINAHAGHTRKCVVVDLDNTLWEGILGEDGPDGINMSQEGMGGAFRRFQLALRDLYDRGIILAVCSKNNADEALRVLSSHPDMALRPEHFAATRINWTDKATNIRSIAEELDLGLDAFVFLDDNPAERSLVRTVLPQVLTVELPEDPAHYVEALMELTELDLLEITDEDRRRGELYAQRRERREWEASAEGLQGHFEGLDLRAEVRPADAFTRARIGQLFRKTNQFNVTGVRYSDAEIEQLSASSDHVVLGAKVSDRFGDHGLVGAVVVSREANDIWCLENFVLSCRVLGHGAELAILAGAIDILVAQGARAVRGLFIHSPRNEPARNIFRDAGFSLEGSSGGTEMWVLKLPPAQPIRPAWIVVEVKTSEEVPA